MAPQVQSIQLVRYRGFRDPQKLSLARLNLLYGENNAGKSALVRILPLLAGSRTSGRPGLNLDAPVLRRAGFREVQWRGPLPTDSDPDLVLGLGLADGATWTWTFRWLDLRAMAVIQRLEIEVGGQKTEFDIIERAGRNPKDADYSGPEGPVRLVFDGLVPRAGASTLIDRHRDGLSNALDGVAWLGAMRQGPTREGIARGARGNLFGDGEEASALVLADVGLRRTVSEWFRAHSRKDVEPEALGAEMQRLVLRPLGASGYDVPFPDAGEGLQQVFPLVVALERLRREGGLLGIAGPGSLPYTQILVFVARALDLAGGDLTLDQQDKLAGWVAEVCIDERFGAAPTHMIQAEWRALAHRLGLPHSDPPRARDEKRHPAKECWRFSMAWARSRGTALVLADQAPRDGHDNSVHDPYALVARGTDGIGMFIADGGGAIVTSSLRQLARENRGGAALRSPANRMVCPPEALPALRSALFQASCPDTILRSHLVTIEAHDALIRGELEEFFERRRVAIQEAETLWVQRRAGNVDLRAEPRTYAQG